VQPLATNIHTLSLIGMPGAGKSTVGIILAKLTGLRFCDTDLDIQVRETATLQQILDSSGYQKLRAIEEEVLLSVDLHRSVISTGGSAVYSGSVMTRLRGAGPLIYLQAEIDTLLPRVTATSERGIASPAGQSFAQIYTERTALYAHHASDTIDVDNSNPDQIARSILALLAR
jgi:shikimate kinase